MSTPILPPRSPRSHARARAVSAEEQRRHRLQVVAASGLLAGLTMLALAQALAMLG